MTPVSFTTKYGLLPSWSRRQFSTAADRYRSMVSAVYQLTCSPLHNYVPGAMKAAFRIFWSRVMERSLHRLLGIIAPLPPMKVDWNRLDGPFFGNDLAEFHADGRHAQAVLRKSEPSDDGGTLREVARRTLAG